MLTDHAPRTRVVLLEIWRPLLVLFVWDVAVTAVCMTFKVRVPPLPLALFGSALALFLGFRVNSAYQRWWEGRVLWGAMINASRSLSRNAMLSIGHSGDIGRERAVRVVLDQIALVHLLRYALRRQPLGPDTEHCPAREIMEQAVHRVNPANAILSDIGAAIDDARRQGLIDTVQQSRLESVLTDITNAQGGMERLKNTPLPSQYRFVPSFFTRAFCVLLPFGLMDTLGMATPAGSTLAGVMFLAVLQIGEDLVDPFANSPHDVPLSAMCRTIERDLLESIGETLPPALGPVRGILW
jgi:putative membrane protein